MRIIPVAAALVMVLCLGACSARSSPLAGSASYDRSHSKGHDDAHRRTLHDGDRIYRDRDGRYYCKRSDGTTGAVAGALAGGILGNVIAPGDSRTLGTLLGAGGGALAGRAIDRRNIRCD